MRFKDDRSRTGRYVPAFVFLIFIFGMAVWFLFNPKSDYSSSEKRYLQQFPEVTVDKVLDGTFGTEFESYFADQFPARSFWVGLNAYYSLDTGNNGANSHVIEFSLKLDSNPEFTSSVLLAYARAAYRLSKEGVSGCKTIFDIAPAYLCKQSGEELRAHML